MKVVQINTFPYKATGRIMIHIHELAQKNKIDSYIVWGRGRKPLDDNEFSISDKLGMVLHGVSSRVFDNTGFLSYVATYKLICFLDKIKPDIIHLHNLHGYYINIKMLFNYLKKNEETIRVVWTIHDCWPITGHCAYFEIAGCDKWQNGCCNCSQLRTYPVSYIKDNSKNNWMKKRELFQSVKLDLVVPSFWLKGILEKSFLKNNDIHVIYNGVDLDVFKPLLGIEKERKLVLGVASEWTDRKGLDDFIKLREILDDSYTIKLVGLSDEQIKKLPDGIIGVKRIADINELVKLYCQATVFVNLSVEETMGMTTVEAMACGTPVIVYNSTALPEIVDHDSGIIIDDIHNLSSVVSAILEISDGCYKNCRNSSYRFEKNSQFNMYIDLYKRLEG